jgi:phosphatidate cytidylyltransferase
VTRVLSGAVLIVLAIVVVWFAPSPVLEAVAFGLLFVGVGELVGIARASGLNVSMWPSVTGALVTLAACGLASSTSGRDTTPLQVILMVQVIAIAAVTMVGWAGGRDALATVSASLLPSLYLALPIGALVAIREFEGPAPLFLLMLTVVVSDSAQYYTGRLAGRTPLAPTISPSKTVEGAVGGFVGGALFFVVAGAWWLPRLPTAFRVPLGLTIVASGIAGDLFESMLKRSAGVKDSSALIPGHGGVLDRIDALLFAAPVYYIVLHYV